MKIGIISDLHIDRDTKRSFEVYIDVLSAEVKSQNIDLLLLAGDISNDYKMSYHFIKTLKDKIGIDVLFVPGNHDYWDNDKKTLEIFEYFKKQPECLIERPYIINEDWAVIGHSGWYDYSYAASEFSREKLESGKFKGSTWQDKFYVDWRLNDQRVSKTFAEAVRKDMEQVGDRHIILMTHIVTHKKFTVPMPHRIFDFYNAYIGTSDFDQLYKQYSIKYSIMGHIHFRKMLVEDGITYICACLGYTRQWRSKNLATEIASALHVIEI
ncbi:metallophosphoesterase [Macrococcus lamae]|uniref:Phosphohydrolase n=1 Tax=Macrococcus lamae TaxID=198484 RepID=A0A4R6BWB4_9STAP|nr:metallophosphoesterase [Macrococcus lamae]TDM12734.1 phosphohydrolase [Macrococcus lamae]